MKKWIPRLLAAAAALLLCAFFALALLAYARPMADQSYDLSLIPADGQAWDETQKGWTVFVQEDGTRKILTPNGGGGYTGLEYPGQTFYFSRTMTEQVDSPSLYLSTANSAVAVYLDGVCLYTDRPDQSGGIGTLRLPMLDADRADVLEVPLPSDYLGKTLTVAQSSGLGETQVPEANPTVWPCMTELSCAYAYESGLIAESFQTAIPAALCFALGALLAAVFVWQGFRGQWDAGPATFSLVAFFLMTALLGGVSFSYRYAQDLSVDLNALCRALSLTALLAFLGERGGRLRCLLWLAAAVQGGTALLGRSSSTSILTTVSEYAGLAGLAAAVILALVWRRAGRRFYRLFTPLLLAALGTAAVLVVLSTLRDPRWGQAALSQVWIGFQNGLPRFLLWRLSFLVMICGAAALAVELIRLEGERRTEERLLLQRGELALENYETLRCHNDEILTLRHDLRNHCIALRGLCREGDLDRIAAYLDSLSAWTESPHDGGYTVHPAVNAVLTALLSRAERLGIQPTVKVELPQSLSIPDSDLCTLLMNLLENAVEAVEKVPEGADRRLQVTLHVRGQYLYVGVENTRFTSVELDREDRLFRSTKPEGIHGYGLKSARAIAHKYHSELRLEAPEGSFSASTALLLPDAEV